MNPTAPTIEPTINPTLSPTIDTHIECDVAHSGTIELGETIYFSFNCTEAGWVLMTDCASDFDPMLFLYDSEGNEIQGLSSNNCDGDDCSDDSCSTNVRETFVIELDVGLYQLKLMPFSSGGEYVVQVQCAVPPPTLNPTAPTSEPTAPTSEPTFVIEVALECGAAQTGHAPATGAYEAFHFELIATDAGWYRFSDCGSGDSGYSKLFLYDSDGNEIQHRSSNACDGNNCDDFSLTCAHRETVAYTIFLEPGAYHVKLLAYAWADREYSVRVDCSIGSPFNATVLPSVDMSDDVLQCDAPLSGTIEREETQESWLFAFNCTDAGFYLFSNCDTDFTYTYLYLHDSTGNTIQSRSTNECDGYNCADPTCAISNRATFNISLHVAMYYVAMVPRWSGELIHYAIDVLCPTPSNRTLAHSTTTTTATTVQPTVFFTTASTNSMFGGDSFLQFNLVEGVTDDIGFRIGVTDDDHFAITSISGSSGPTTPISFDAAGSSIEMSADLSLLDREMRSEPTNVQFTAHGIEFGEHWCLGVSSYYGATVLSLARRVVNMTGDERDTTAMLWQTDGSWLGGPITSRGASCWSTTQQNDVTVSEDHTFVDFNGQFRLGSPGMDERHHSYLSLVGAERTAVVFRDDGLILNGPRDDYQWTDWPPRNASNSGTASVVPRWLTMANVLLWLIVTVLLLGGLFAVFQCRRRSGYVLVKRCDSEGEEELADELEQFVSA